MKQWRILVIVLGVIILLLVANFRYILRVYFDSSKYYILFHSISGLLFFFAVCRFHQEGEEIALKLAITKKIRQLLLRKITQLAENPKGKIIQASLVSIFRCSR